MLEGRFSKNKIKVKVYRKKGVPIRARLFVWLLNFYVIVLSVPIHSLIELNFCVLACLV